MNTKKIVLSSLLLPNLLFAQQVVVSDTTLVDEVMITENRLQIPFNKQSRNIQIIDRKEIQNLPATSINEVLAYISGVDIRQRGAFGAQADVSIDGGSFDQTLILLNGIKISDIQTGHHSMNLPVSLDAVERIEVLRGPAARVFGINALTGAINIITKLSEKNNVLVDVKTGSSFMNKEEGDGKGIYAGGITQVVVNVGTERFRNLISTSYAKTNGQRYNSTTEDIRLFYQTKYRLSHDNEIDIIFGYIDNQFGANGYYASPGDRESYELVKTFISSLGAMNRLGDRFVFKPRISYRKNKDDYRYFRNDLSKARSEHETDALSMELNSVLNTNFGDFGFGAESRMERIESTNIGDHDRFNHGLFAEYKTESIQNLYLNVGAYMNYNTQYGWQVFPGLDASYTISHRLKASFNIGSSQRLPSYTDLYLKQPKNVGNSNLRPEEAWQYEFGLRYFQQNAYLQVGYFNRKITNFIDWVTDSPDLIFQAENFGNNQIEGFSINAGDLYQFGDKNILRFAVSYNYLNPKKQIYEDGISSKYILENLKHQAIFRLNYHYSHISLGLANRWIEREWNKPYLISDAKLAFNFGQWQISTDLNNIFNQSYAEIGSILLPKRWVSVGVKWRMDFLQ